MNKSENYLLYKKKVYYRLKDNVIICNSNDIMVILCLNSIYIK